MANPQGETPYRVTPYSIEALIERLQAAQYAARDQIRDKSQCSYFEDYFGALGAKTMVSETRYIDRDYLEDYSAFYVRCLTEYGKRCQRIHFFSIEFSEEEFGQLLRGESTALTASGLQESYLGFVVVKPLPQTVVGRTCLKTYPDDNGRRHYPCRRTYDANLFGLPLQVQTVAFQEQDQVLAACATSALWSVFQCTGRQFHHPIPSPGQITRSATASAPSRTRAIPSGGLSLEEMSGAIRAVGLEPICVAIHDTEVLLSTVYAYLRGCVPVVAVVELTDVSGGKVLGRHAVGVTGFSLGHTQTTPFRDGFLCRASMLDEVYAHDDQVGPYARMVLDGVQVKGFASLSTSWRCAAAGLGLGDIRAVPEVALIPLYHKIRIPYAAIHEGVRAFDALLRATLCPLRPLVWDIHLTEVSRFKAEIRDSAAPSGTARHDVLVADMPRFIWRATAAHDETPVLDLVFDATEMWQADLLVSAVQHRPDLVSHVRQHADLMLAVAAACPGLSSSFVVRLLERLRDGN